MSKAEAIARTGGLIGLVFWSMADSDSLVRELDRIVELVGTEHAGLGTDFFGFRDAPRDVQHIGQLGVLTEKLVARGYDDAAILGMLGGNYLRVFDRVWR
jgi:membrane dipeptidase